MTCCAATNVLTAAADIDDWHVRSHAIGGAEHPGPAADLANHRDLDQLMDDERAEIEAAVAAVRRHRTTMLGYAPHRHP